MPDDPVRVADTRAWLVKASKDLQAAEIDLTAGAPLVEDVLFHCQQAVEKAMKALMTWHDLPFRRTHDLVELSRQCVTIDPTLESLVSRTSVLTEAAWKFRYPGEVAEPTLEEARESLALARDVVGAVLARLPAEVQP